MSQSLLNCLLRASSFPSQSLSPNALFAPPQSPLAPPLYPPPSATLSLEGEEGGGESDAPPPSSPPAQAQDEATMPDDEALHSSEDENHTMGRTLGEGFICLVCQYKCLSPEALHTHYQVEHPSASLGYRPNNSGKGALKCACMVVEPIYSSSQKRQLAVLHSFSFFWVVVATPRGLPQDVKFKIFSFSRTDSYYDFLNFRSPEEFAKSLWPSFRASNAIRLQFYSQVRWRVLRPVEGQPSVAPPPCVRGVKRRVKWVGLS